MADVIVRGTTPSLIVDLSDVADISVSDISAVSLIIKRRTEKIELGLSDMIISGDTLAYHWTQAETLKERTAHTQSPMLMEKSFPQKKHFRSSREVRHE